jgi:hypothetical protein
MMAFCPGSSNSRGIRVADSGALDQLAEVRLGIDKIFVSHRELSDHLGGHL